MSPSSRAVVPAATVKTEKGFCGAKSGSFACWLAALPAMVTPADGPAMTMVAPCVFFRVRVPVSAIVCVVAKVWPAPAAKVMVPPVVKLSALATACARLPSPPALVFVTSSPLAWIVMADVLAVVLTV